MRRNKETLGPPGPPSFSESKTRIVGFDWSTDHPDRAAVSPDAASFVPEGRSPDASGDLSELHRGPGVGEQLLADARTAPDAAEYSTTQVPSKADVEWDRFLACAVPTPNGLGLYDPSESPDMPSGVPIEDWRAFECDCARPGRGSRA